ncbi:prophage endopeptidase [Pseudomonas linyingensis]|uniref:Prophage endopeptidase n=1 Tax=Pseudomonas linyingensis TaxID=915471 RepID=A0A1H6Z1L7_9PSED|nr:lysis system i-spanin subunit Rz [Pseudomonas linyingensis]SEJ46556.1 prophage endopeptidase [Pseudomonas linyingensis]
MIRLLLAALAVVSLLALWLTSERSGLQRDLATAEGQVEQLQQSARLAEQAFAARDAVDQQHTEELSHARAENDRLRADVAAGGQRLFVKTACPAVPAYSGAAGVADAGAAELAADARPDYHALRDELALSRQMILGLQQYVREVCVR